MTDLLHDLLDDEIIGVRPAPDIRNRLALPGVLEALGRTELYAFTALQAHQEHAWYTFLVQLAAIALEKNKEPLGSWPDAPAWRSLLLDLVCGDRRPWCLLVKDLSHPAFMQPAVPERSLDGFKTVSYPDGLDVLITAKDHDVKHSRIGRPLPEHWIYALITLQTTQGFLGKGNYGIARMNGGFASRPWVGYSPGVGWPERFQRDVSVLRRSRSQLLRDYGYADRDGLALVWLKPWDGSDSEPLERCDPLLVEISRRVRFEGGEERLWARTRGTSGQRLLAKERKGDVGDPWTPVSKAEGAALTAGSAGFSYKLTQELLFSGDWAPGISQQIQRDDPERLLFCAAVLVRGQGKTDGLRKRLLPLPPRVRAILGSSQDRATLETRAKRRVDDSAIAWRRILRPALLVLLQAAPDKLDFTDDRSRSWLEKFDTMVDQIFFDHLWRTVERVDPDPASEEAEAREDEHAVSWQRELVGIAQSLLEDAMQSIPLPAARRYRALAAAERVFRGSAIKHFHDAMQKEMAT